ncbi:hypothetical protein STENM327S_06673 [Streptomyces tendae]
MGLVLYRQLPKIKRYLAYLPEGPVINWFAPNLQDWMEPMLAHLKQQGAFSVKMGPPVIIRRWDATSIKKGIQDPDVKRLRTSRRTTSNRALRGGRQAAPHGLAAGRGRRRRLR